MPKGTARHRNNNMSIKTLHMTNKMCPQFKDNSLIECIICGDQPGHNMIGKLINGKARFYCRPCHRLCA